MRTALARAWAGLAAGHLQAGRLAESREALESAVGLAPGEAAYRVLLAMVLFRQNQLREARRVVDEALELAPGTRGPRALRRPLRSRGPPEPGRRRVGEAALAGGSHALAGKIERGRREMAVEEGMGRESSRYFVVLYDRDVPQALVKDLFGLLDEAFNVLHDRLGEYPRDEITVILYSRVAFRDVTRMPDWGGARTTARSASRSAGSRPCRRLPGCWGSSSTRWPTPSCTAWRRRGSPAGSTRGSRPPSRAGIPGRSGPGSPITRPRGITTLANIDRGILRARGEHRMRLRRPPASRSRDGGAAGDRACAASLPVSGGATLRRGLPRGDVASRWAEFEERWAKGLR